MEKLLQDLSEEFLEIFLCWKSLGIAFFNVLAGETAGEIPWKIHWKIEQFLEKTLRKTAGKNSDNISKEIFLRYVWENTWRILAWNFVKSLKEFLLALWTRNF